MRAAAAERRPAQPMFSAPTDEHGHVDAGRVHGVEPAIQVAAAFRYRHRVTAAIEQRLAADGFYEFELGTIFDDFGQGAVRVDVGMHVNDFCCASCIFHRLSARRQRVFA